jgi:hypothetical protein
MHRYATAWSTGKLPMSILVRWTSDGIQYCVYDLGESFRLTATGNVIRCFEDSIGLAGRAEWLVLSDAEKTQWAEMLLALALPT